MTWTKLPPGSPHSGKTIPQAFFDDPEYVFAAFESNEFTGAAWDDAQEVTAKARRIRVPRDENEDQDVLVLYRLLPDGRFGGYSVVERSHPRFRDYTRFSVGQSRGLDFGLVRRLAPGDPDALGIMLSAVKFDFLGDPNCELTAEECAGFFEDESCFVPPHYPPRLEYVFLRRGTVYRVVREDGLSEPHTADRDMQVGVVHLAFSPGEAAAYTRADGADIVTWWADEPRG